MTRAASAEPSAEPIAIVGMAALYPGAPDAKTYWANILSGVDAISDVPAARWDADYFDPERNRADRFYCRRGGFVDELATFDPSRFGVMPVAVDDAEPDQLLALQVASDAIDDAGGSDRVLTDPARVGIVLGRGGYLTPGLARIDQRVRGAEQVVAILRDTLPGLDEHELALVRKAFDEQLGPERPEAMIGLVPNLAASRVANRLDLQGPAYTIDAACASSLVAVDHAVQELRSGRCDAFLAGGVHHCHDVTFWSVFTQLGALSRTQQIRPFDRRADGLLIGEGTGIVVLKRLHDAERDGDRVYAVVRGVGVASDGRASSIMKPKVAGQVLAVERAWRQAGLDPATVDLIEAHGTATPAGDDAELGTLAAVFGHRGDGPRAGLGSVKSMIGHAMPAAGVAGLIKAAYALHHGVLPPTLHCDEPHEALEQTAFRIVREPEPWEASGRPRRAGVNAFGFGGINAHVVLDAVPASTGASTNAAWVRRPTREVPREVPREVRSRTHGDREGERVLLLAGPTVGDVRGQLGDEDADDELLARDDHHAVPKGGPVRLAIVGATPRRLALARRVVEQGRRWHGRNDLWFAPDPLLAAGGLAFLFPGVEPEFDPIVADVAEWFGLPVPDLVADGGLGFQGRAIVEVGRLLHGALDACGVRPDVIAGHSIGEWTGMIVSELIPPAEVDSFVASIDPAELEVPGVAFAALGCGAREAAVALADDSSGALEGVVVSHDNCPHQSIVCGPEASIRAALHVLKQQKILGQELPFRSGFHSPMFEPYLEPIRAHLQRLPMQPPRVPLWSATDLAPYPGEPSAIRDLAVRHLVEPVRFRGLIERLHGEGVRGFVQLGVGSLNAFVDDTLADSDRVAVVAATSKRPGIDQLRRVLAALWAEGRDGVDLARLRRQPARAKGMRLQLGAPLVRLDSVHLSARLPARDELPAGLPASDPVLAELSAVLDETATASRDVIDALAAARAGAPRPARVTAPEPSSARSSTRPIEVSVGAMPWLLDHCFYRQPDGWPDPADRFPVVPMTATLELLAAEAQRLVPSMVVTGLRDVRALRWIAAAPAIELTATATETAPGEVKVVLEGFARGTVLLADSYPEPAAVPLPDPTPLANERATDIPASRLYGDRWMFHGPRYQGVDELGPIADDGIRGTLRSLDAPGGLLDNAGQLMGYWVMVSTEVDRLALPMTVSRVRFFGPHPPAGRAVECTVRLRELTDQSVRADLELVHEGVVWCVIDGWEDKRFDSDDLVWPLLRYPEHNLLTESQPGGWSLVRERWHNSASRELMMRRYTRSAERADYEERNPRDQRHWLLGRIAVKDAVRQHLASLGCDPVFPIEVEVANDENGRPFVVSRPNGAERLAVSLAHTDWLAVAIVARDQPVGIDVEPVEPRTRRFESMALTGGERSLLEAAPAAERDRLLARLWAVKEAAGKARGTGLEGRPKQFETTELDGDRHRAGSTWFGTTTIHTPEGEFVVAWTEIA